MAVTPKKVLVYGGITLVWIGGFYIAVKAGDAIGKLLGAGCLKATEKLLAL
jgi:hypothetical protein